MAGKKRKRFPEPNPIPCDKVNYADHDRARSFAMQYERFFGHHLSPYSCTKCGYFHLRSLD